MPRKGLFDLHEMKRAGEKIAWLTAYDYPTATFEEAAGIDMTWSHDAGHVYDGATKVADRLAVLPAAARSSRPRKPSVGSTFPP